MDNFNKLNLKFCNQITAKKNKNKNETKQLEKLYNQCVKMLEFFHPPNLNQQPELMQGHPENISTTLPCHERTGKLRLLTLVHGCLCDMMWAPLYQI